ncbi:Gfo/Idh/MocA family protein [Verrucomicrobiota bacterium]
MARGIEKYVGARAYTDYEKMLDKEELDFLVVATPSMLHCRVARLAVEHDVHVFVEKPFSLDIEEGRSLAGALEGRNLVNQVGYVNRFNAVFVETKRILDAGIIGPVVHFHSRMYGRTVLSDSHGSWRATTKTGGGCLYEFASHAIDLANYFVGVPDRVTGSLLEKIYSADVEDMVSSTFLYDGGLTGNIFVNWSDVTYRKAANQVEFLGTEGKITADQHALRLYLKEAVPGSGFSQGWNMLYITDLARPVRFYVRGNEFTAQLDAFIDAIKGGKEKNLCTFSDALATDITIARIKEDADKQHQCQQK